MIATGELRSGDGGLLGRGRGRARLSRLAACQPGRAGPGHLAPKLLCVLVALTWDFTRRKWPMVLVIACSGRCQKLIGDDVNHSEAA